jgi:hypothetical protein
MTARYIPELDDAANRRHRNRGATRAGPSDDELTAYHESGHGVGTAVAQGKVPVEMWIGERGGGGCLARHPSKGSEWEPNADGGKKVMAAVTNGLKPSAAARKTFRPSLIALLCGEIAQRKRADGDRSDDYYRVGSSDDRAKLCSVLGSITANEAEFNKELHEITVEARHIVNKHWDVIEELAHDLLEFRRLDERAIRAIVGDLCPIKEEVRPASRNVDDDVLHYRTDGIVLAGGERLLTREIPAGYRAEARNGFLVFVPEV